jgi:hypothetical protein
MVEEPDLQQAIEYFTGDRLNGRTNDAPVDGVRDRITESGPSANVTDDGSVPWTNSRERDGGLMESAGGGGGGGVTVKD